MLHCCMHDGLYPPNLEARKFTFYIISWRSAKKTPPSPDSWIIFDAVRVVQRNPFTSALLHQTLLSQRRTLFGIYDYYVITQSTDTS
jgi:hypothetical protein